jgi:hypothetical protein
MSAEIAAEAPQAPPNGAAGKNHARLKLPRQFQLMDGCRRTSPMSAEIAAGNFSQ